MKNKWLIPLLLLLPLLLVACGKGEIESNFSPNKEDLRTVQDFTFTNQDNEEVSFDDLKDKWWVADFIFTNCEDVCIPMTYNMQQLQMMLAEEGLDAELISFSVDPDFDTPEVLKEYAESYGADLTNWNFLTGYEFETIEKFALESFMTGVQRDPNSDQVAHGVRFFLINPEGQIIKHYMGTEADEMDVIFEDLKKVL